MIALRKDVKVGFTIGGIALGVFGVYLGLTALAGGKPDTSMTGANLQLTPFGSTATPTQVVDANKKATPLVASTQKPANTPSNSGPTMANPTQQVTVTESKNADIWDNAFQTGKIQPAVTVTPDATAKHDTNTPKPSDVISAINTPTTDTSKSTNPTSTAAKPESGTGTASANEPSGSLASQTSSTLSKTPDAKTQVASSVKSHTVEVGDTFSSISASYYGDAKYFKLLVDANPQIDPSKLKPGMVIKVPELVKKEPKSDTTDVPAEQKIDTTKQYIVKSGDSLSKIASTLYGDQNMWSKIYDLNKSMIGDSPAKLKLGMVLNLPSPPTHKQ